MLVDPSEKDDILHQLQSENACASGHPSKEWQLLSKLCAWPQNKSFSVDHKNRHFELLNNGGCSKSYSRIDNPDKSKRREKDHN